MKATKEDLHESGRPLTQEEFIDKIKTDDEFAKKWGNLGPIYGKQWRKWEQNSVAPWGGLAINHIDQITNLINDLKTNPDSRRLMVSAWNVGELDQMTLPPCHYGFQVYTRELTREERSQHFRGNKETYTESKWRDDMGISKEEYFNQIGVPTRAISLMWNQRSVDTFLGLPFNIASYGLLLEIIAKEVNMVPDELIGNLGDVHLYKNHIEQAKEQLNREPYPLPKLIIDQFDETNHYIGDMDDVSEYNVEQFKLENYQSHPTIKAPLSN